MSELPERIQDPGDPGPDALRRVDEFKRAPFRVGCLGCNLVGWAAAMAVAAAVALLVWAVRRFFP